MTQEDERRAIDLSDAASRAMHAGNIGLADKLTQQAAKVLSTGSSVSFEDWAAPRNLNLEQYEGFYVSKHTAELAECWGAARR